MDRPRIGILVLNKNGCQWLSLIFQSLREQGYPNKKVYLVDNASTDGSVPMTLSSHPEVTVIQMPQNLGYCMAYNLAIPQAFADGCDWVILANNDIRLETGCLQELARAARSALGIGVLGPAFLAWNQDEPNYYMLGNHPYAISAMKEESRQSLDVKWVEGSFWMINRQCFEKVGPLDPFLYFYWEEADFCRRARLRGWKVVLVPRALARHYAGGWSASDAQNQKIANHLQTRNFFIYNLADPSKSFPLNLFSALHLLLVNLKQGGFRNPASIFFHLKVFAGILGEIGSIYQKWSRDRQGKPPGKFSKEYQSIQVQILRGPVEGKTV